MRKQSEQKETTPGSRRALHGSEKEPRQGSSWRPQTKMAPREESRAKEKSTTGTDERKMWVGSKPGDGPEGRGTVMYEWKDGGETSESSGCMKQIHAVIKMAPGPAAMLIPIQKGESPRGFRSEVKGAIRLGHARILGRSKSLPPHLGLQKFKIKESLDDSQKKACVKPAKKAQQEESYGASHLPPILQLHEEGGWTPESYDNPRDPERKTYKNGKRMNMQHKETQRKEKQTTRAAPKGALEPQKDKKFTATSRAAKKKYIRGLGFIPLSSSGIQHPRPKIWPSKGTKMTVQRRGKGSARHYCPSRPLSTGDIITSTGPPLRHQVNLSSYGTKTGNRGTLLLHKEGKNQIMVIRLGMIRGTWPPGMPWPSWDYTGTFELFDIHTDRWEAETIDISDPKEDNSAPHQGSRGGSLHDMIIV